MFSKVSNASVAPRLPRPAGSLAAGCLRPPPQGVGCPTAIGKKNWLFIGDPKTGDHAAAFYTLIGSDPSCLRICSLAMPGFVAAIAAGRCHRTGIDAQAHLTDLFTRLPIPTVTTKTLPISYPLRLGRRPKSRCEDPASLTAHDHVNLHQMGLRLTDTVIPER